jgi:hypothetical protein
LEDKTGGRGADDSRPGGIPPDSDFHGQSLRPVLEGRSVDKPIVTAELLPLDLLRFHTRAVISDRLRKRIEKPDGSYELYNLNEAPDETRDLAQVPMRQRPWREQFAAARDCWESPACRSQATATLRSRVAAFLGRGGAQ